MAALMVRAGGQWRIPPVRVRQGGAWVAPKAVYVRINGVWVAAWSSLTATISGDSTSYNNGLSNLPRTRSMQVGCAVTASANGQPISYQWAVTGSSGGVSNISLSSPNSAAAVVSATAALNVAGEVSLSCVVSSNGTSMTLYTSVHFNYFNTV